MIDKLVEFFEFSENKKIFNLWLEEDHFKVYVRKAQRWLEERRVVTLDIASIEVDEEYQNKGIFSSFLKEAHELNPWNGTYIENVCNPHLFNSLKKKGWKQHFDGVSFFLLKS